MGGAICFLQAEDGIRDIGVTGVQTCALPIYVVTHCPFKHVGCQHQVIASYTGKCPLSKERGFGYLYHGTQSAL